MKAEDYARLKRLLFEAAERTGPDRSAYLDQACRGDAELRREVDAILDEEGDPAGIFRTAGAVPPVTLDPEGLDATSSATGRISPPSPTLGTPKQIGPYRIYERIGEGGMGVVYAAEQMAPIHRKVALKVIKPGMDSGEILARFEAERQALALMDHPNIAHIHDAGTTEQGLPYFVMEYVPGIPITDYADQRRLTTEERLRLFQKVCDGVQHAHQKAVIHRDLKPSNILVIDVEGKAIPKIIDFGVAKATTQKLTDRTMYTSAGQIIGTPEYMSPEQADFTGDVDTRTDIYSLGVVLYVLLTGALPFEAKRFRDSGPGGIIKLLREEEPPKPSTRISTLGERTPEVVEKRRTDPRQLTSQLRGDLDWIVMRSLDKDRNRRYGSPQEFAQDIQRHLEQRPVLAGPPGRTYRLRKFVHRNRLLVGAAGVVVTVLLVALVSMSLLTGWALRERTRAEAGRAQAEAINEFVTRALVSSDPSQGGEEDFQVRAAMDQAIELLDAGELDDQPATEAALRLTISKILNGNARSEQALELAESALRIHRELHSGDHTDLVTSLCTVANCLRAVNRTDEALERHKEALEMSLRLHKGDHPDVASSRNALASCLQSLGRWNDALPEFRSALEMRKRLFDPEHPEVASSLQSTAWCLQSLGRPSEALAYFEEALEIRERLYDGDHPDIAWSRSNIAVCLESLGRPEDALPEFQASLEILQRIYQGDHPDVERAQNNVASCLGHLGRTAEALPMYQASLEMSRRLFSEDHPDVAYDLGAVGWCLLFLDRSDEAAPLFESALAMYQRLYPEDHPDVAKGLNALATCLNSLGRSEEALVNYAASLEMYRRILPADHPRFLDPQLGRAQTLAALGRYSDAESVLLDAVGQCDRSEPSRLRRWPEVLEQLADLYDAWHVSDPTQGYDLKATAYREKLEQ